MSSTNVSSARPSLYPRFRSQDSTRSSIDRQPDTQPSGQDRTAFAWLREPVSATRTSAAMSRLTVGAAARFAGCVGNDVSHIMVAVLSWIFREFIQGCAAYAQGMYPPIVAVDRELEVVEPAARPGEAATIAAKRPCLTIVASNEPPPAKHRSGRA